MKLASVRLQNFRSYKDQTIEFNDYTCLVGPNGAGKSCVLTALNIFFRNTASCPTDVTSLSEEDFHKRNTSEPIRITLTFTDLSAAAQSDLSWYYRNDKLVVFSRATWDAETSRAQVQQFGARMVMPHFAEFFKNQDGPVSKLKEIYSKLREEFKELPAESTKQKMLDALRTYEEAHDELCDLLDDPNQFYGWSKGVSLLDKYVQWVYVPAVKDASTEQDESNKTALGQILERTVREKVNFKTPIAELKKKLEEEYRGLVDAEKDSLNELQSSLQDRLQSWTSTGTRLALNWHYDYEKSITINQPSARVNIGEDDFMGAIARLGHGMQRSFLVAMLQELAGYGGESSPTLILGFEEPELYQHPPQAQHVANLLHSLAGPQHNTQVIVTSHSPFFVTSQRFEDVRMVRKQGESRATSVNSTTYEKVDAALASALCEKPSTPKVMMSKIEQIMQPSQRELYFCSFAVLVEGLEDVAFIATQLHILDKWDEFRRLGGHFVIAQGKVNLSRPLAIANELKIPAFVVFDGDCDKTKPDDVKNNTRDNGCLLRLCGVEKPDPIRTTDFVGPNVVMWAANIFTTVKAELTGAVWKAAEDKARVAMELTEGVRQKNNMLIAGTLECLHEEKKISKSLSNLCEAILDFGNKSFVG
jgi:putative ATP-dependent endonuclease of OLD family